MKSIICLLFLLTAMHPFRAQADEIEKTYRQALEAEKDQGYETVAALYLQLHELYIHGYKSPLLGKALLRGGNYCFRESMYVEANEIYFAGLSASREVDDQLSYAGCLIGIGNTFSIFNDLERAVVYYTQAYDITKREGFESTLSDVIVNLVGAYNDMGNAEIAEKYLAEERLHLSPDSLEQAYRLDYNQGMLDYVRGDYISSCQHLRKALGVFDGQQSFLQAGICNELGKAFLAMQQPDSALLYLHQSVHTASQTHAAYLLRDAYSLIYNHYKDIGRYDSTVYYQSLYVNLTDTLFNEQLISSQRNKLLMAEKRQSDLQISNLNQEVKGLNQQLRGLLGFMLVVVIFLLVIFYYNKQIRQAHKLLVMRNEELIRQNNIYQTMKSRGEQVSLSAADEPVCKEDEGSDPAEEDSSDDEEDDELKHATTHLTSQKADALLLAILEVMNDVEAISDKDFTMTTLAKRVNSNTTYVSAVFNDTYHKNFKQFLNEYRIREVCRRLTDDTNYGHFTITAIAESVGFSSRNNFISIFKKVMDMTPSTYQKLATEHRKSADL